MRDISSQRSKKKQKEMCTGLCPSVGNNGWLMMIIMKYQRLINVRENNIKPRTNAAAIV